MLHNVLHNFSWRILALCALLSACAIQPEQEQSFEQRLNLLQTEHRFGAAERAIMRETAQASNDEQQQLLADNRKKAAAFEHSIVSTADEQQKKNEWAEAGATLNQALEVYPESSALVDANNRYLEARDEFLKLSLHAHRVLRAKRIPDELQSLKAINSAGGGPKYATDKENLEREAKDTAEALLARGQKLMANKRWRQARELLNLSQNLHPDNRTETALRVANRHIKPQRVKPASKPAQVPADTEREAKVDSAAVAAAMHRYRFEVKRKNLAVARQQIEQALRLDPNSRELKTEYSQFLALLNSSAEQHIEQGKYHYSLGDIDTAITHWETAYALNPEDDALKERLEKARRFKTRYEQLKR